MAKVSVEQAVQNAIAAWLAPNLPDVAVSPRWVGASTTLPDLAISVIPAGPRQDDILQPTIIASDVIHGATVSARITTATATDLASANAVLNACKASYNAHRADLGAHQAADTTNVISAPDANDLASGIALAAQFLGSAGVLNAHFLNGAAHVNAELLQLQGHSAFAQNASQLAPPTDTPTLVAAAEGIRAALNKHYVARIYTWQIRACLLPLQLDVWAKYDATRDDLMARLEPLLNPDPSMSAGAPTPQNAAECGLLLSLGDGFTAFVDCWFDGPQKNDAPDAEQKSEFRSTYKGTASFMLTLKLQSARLVAIVLKQTIGAPFPPTSNMLPDTYTISPAANSDGYALTVS